MGTYDLVVGAAEEFLKASDSVSANKSKSNIQIIDHLKKRIEAGTLQVSLSDGSMLNYLSVAANNDPQSGIVSGGPRKGYWYDPDAKSKSEAKPIDEEQLGTGNNKTTIYERDFYPIVQLWLEQKGYKAKDMSNLKSGGAWGNPDIIGVDRVELFGAVEVDLVSCEVKLNSENWERMIFEAISHKRFSNRSWFCYRVKSDDEPLPKGIEYYAERYKVGIVQIFITDKEMMEIKDKSKEPLHFIDRTIERTPALYDYVPLREQRAVVERASISLTVTF
ncbi:hypothetical protein [Lichenifustis flavocetrariae]|uniref:Uncharacterized protein n=1 Tax=Lichenifustis flavocetrariae TaxID=2949735 RepID=A0AA41YWU8_9HYPH|nr:hypothetical protein [Lichenifustis flavocetrariae]MCW6508458.1 hypothetical protein [Lichenifustis flavocetrariae]